MEKSSDLVLLGGGGHCMSVIEAALSAGMSVSAILDVPAKVGQYCLNYEIVGSNEDIPRLVAGGARFIVTVGSVKSPDVRIMLHGIIEQAGGEFATVVARTAVVSELAKVGAGTVVLHNAVVNAGATVGRGCIINTAALIEHEVEVGDYCHISTGAIVNGQCRIGRGAFIGSGAVIAQCRSVCAGAVVGAGAVVVKDITEPGIYAGVPAVRIS